MAASDAVKAAPGDLDSNRQGLLSGAQAGVLRRHRLGWAAGALAFTLLAAAVLAALALRLRDPSFADRGVFFIALAPAALWLWLLRRAWSQWLRVNRDLRERNVRSVEGRVRFGLHTGPGVVPVLKYEIRVGDERFPVAQDEFFQFESGKSYRVYYSAHARVFLGAVPLDADGLTAGGAQAAPGPDVPGDRRPAQPAVQMPEPLTRREVEILHLIAAGHSNREIASRLFLSLSTVKMYTSQLYQKLGVGRRTEAVARARELGLL